VRMLDRRRGSSGSSRFWFMSRASNRIFRNIYRQLHPLSSVKYSPVTGGGSLDPKGL
jgi:hypothetical protein